MLENFKIKRHIKQEATWLLKSANVENADKIAREISKNFSLQSEDHQKNLEMLTKSDPDTSDLFQLMSDIPRYEFKQKKIVFPLHLLRDYNKLEEFRKRIKEKVNDDMLREFAEEYSKSGGTEVTVGDIKAALERKTPKIEGKMLKSLLLHETYHMLVDYGYLKAPEGTKDENNQIIDSTNEESIAVALEHLRYNTDITQTSEKVQKGAKKISSEYSNVKEFVEKYLKKK